MGRLLLPLLASFSFLLLHVLAQAPASAPPSPGEAEAKRCEERIASVQRDALNRYDAALQDLQAVLQKAADLEGALAVRAERQRLGQENALSQANYVNDPKALRTLQTQTVARMQELIGQLVDDTVPKLVEFKKNLTVAGRLDEAVAVRTAIERLQGGFLPNGPVAPGTVVTAEVLVRSYTTDRARADTLYKNQRLSVRGSIAGYKADADGKNYLVFLSGSATAAAFVQCAFPLNEYHFREENQFGSNVLVVNWGPQNASVLRLQRGAALDVTGHCSGLDESIRLGKCEFTK